MLEQIQHKVQLDTFYENKRKFEELKEQMQHMCEIPSSTGESQSSYATVESCNHSEEDAEHNCTTNFQFLEGDATDEKLKFHKGKLVNALDSRGAIE